jgi:hypothetical protein
MITLTLCFWILVVLFGVIGAMRGWAKELLVTFSVVLSLFMMDIMGRFGPLKVFAAPLGSNGFWPPTILLLLLVLIGYQTPMIVRLASGKLVREKFSDAFLGFFIGLINGYLIFGCLWYFMMQAGYPFAPGITKPPDPQPFIVNYLPPVYLTGPALYVTVALAFVFILLVFI